MDSNLEENNFSSCSNCFEVKVDDNQVKSFLCKLGNCGKLYQSQSTAIRHIRLKHRAIFDEIKAKKSAQTENGDQHLNCPVEIRVKVIPNDIIKACVELVTVNGLPLRAVDHPAFRKVLNPYLIALDLKGIHLVINRETIKEYIEKEAIKIKAIITKQVQKKAISLMLDIASRYNRSVLGISIAYMYEGTIAVYTIGMHVLRFSSTATNIVGEIKECLTEYGITLKQIVSVTSDNGANMIRSTALLEQSYREENVHGLAYTDGSCEIGSEEYIDDTIFDDKYYEDILHDVRNAFCTSDYTHLMHGISCGAHCLQLVIKHAIDKSPETQTLLAKCRELVKKLRSPTFRNELHSAGCKMAILEVETRWGSMYSMVCSVR